MKRVLFFLILLFNYQAFANSIGEDVNQFAFALSSKIEEKNENLAFSPFSIFSNLSLLYFGAQGQTASQIKSALHLSVEGDKFLKAFPRQLSALTTTSKKGYKLNIANALFAHKGTTFLTRFIDIAYKDFAAKLQAVDFENPDDALKTINRWVSTETQGKIPTLMEEGDINSATRLVIANACYFEGEWVHPFLTKSNQMAPFNKEDGTTFKAQYLHQLTHFPYYEDAKVQAVALPFIRDTTNQPFIECLLILPKKNGVAALEQSLTIKEVDNILLKAKPVLVDLTVPKFCFSKKLDLNQPLQSLDMTLPFTYAADFSKIDGVKDLYLDKVVHETFFSFHENGVTAASATGSSIGFTSVPPNVEPSQIFKADHPYLFMIVDYHSRAILFMGRVMQPDSEDCNAR